VGRELSTDGTTTTGRVAGKEGTMQTRTLGHEQPVWRVCHRVLYVGVDAHRVAWQLTLMDKTGKVLILITRSLRLRLSLLQIGLGTWSVE